MNMSVDLERLKKLKEQKDNNQLKKHPVNVCHCCGKPEFLYICESGHPNCFCRDCLILAVQVNRHRRVFKAQCEKPDCNFIPIIPLKSSTKHLDTFY